MPEKQRLLELALQGLEAERAKIHDEIAEIESQLGSGRPVATRKAGDGGAAAQPRQRMTAAQKKKISEAMKRRYAAMKAANTATAAAKVNKSPVGGGSRLTAAGRKKLSDLMKKRWAERRKGKTK